MGVHVDGQWCSSIKMKKWDPCAGCTVRWMPSLRYSDHTAGRANGLPVSPGKLLVPPWCMWTTKGVIDGLWKGEKKCIVPKAKDADLWIMIWEELHRIHL